MKPGRNDPCSCGSGKKFKHCCEGKVAPVTTMPLPAEINQYIALYNAGRYTELESRARLLVGQYPDFGFGWKLLGGALQMQGKNALPAFRKVAQLMPDNAEAHYNLGVALKSLGQLNSAVASYRLALKIKPNYAEAHSNLGNALKDLGQLEDAVVSYRRAIEINPGSADAHNSLGTALKDLKQLDDAVVSYRRAAALKPDFAMAYYNLGNAQSDLGQLDNAVACYRQAIIIQPDFTDAHNNLGVALKDLGQLDAALASFRKTVELKPDYAEVHNNLGITLEKLGQFDAAVSSYRRAVELKPDYTDAYINLSAVLFGNKQLDAALDSCRRVLELEPDSADAHNNLGVVLKELLKLDSAVASYSRAIEINPNFTKAHINLGAVMRVFGQHDNAAECYRRALEIDPKCTEAILGVGQLRMESGEMAEAEQMFKKALEIKADDLDARFWLTQVKKGKADNDNLAALVAVELAARNGVSPITDKQAIPLQFALGNCFDDIGDYDRAFPYFIEGCRLKRANIEYDAMQMTQYFSSIMRVFDRETIERLRVGGNSSRLPIFVLGMPRSGTTLTEQIIASHPDVHGAGELVDLEVIVKRRCRDGADFPNNITELGQVGIAACASDYVAGLHRRAPDAKHIIDKMPANFLALGLIHLMLPNAKVIHVNRNPVDTCLSCYMQLFNGNNQSQTYDLAELGRYYVDYARLMEHWRNVLPDGAFLDVQYEAIVADQETEARCMIDYCGLDWDDSCIDFHKNKRRIRTASVTQVRQPIYKSSVERWRPYEKFLAPLLDALGDLAPKRN